MERGWLACALRRFSWQIKGRAAVQLKEPFEPAGLSTAVGPQPAAWSSALPEELQFESQ